MNNDARLESYKTLGPWDGQLCKLQVVSTRVTEADVLWFVDRFRFELFSLLLDLTRNRLHTTPSHEELRDRLTLQLMRGSVRTRWFLDELSLVDLGAPFMEIKLYHYPPSYTGAGAITCTELILRTDYRIYR